RQRPGGRRLGAGRSVRRDPAIFGERPLDPDGVQRAGPDRRQPAAQQSHALSRPHLSDRPAGRLPAPAVTSRARTKIMALTPFIGEVVMYAFNYPPKSWALCNGQFLPINQNQALFSILGTTYGGNGQTTFALPELRGRVAMHTGSGHNLGEAGGQEVHTITMSEMPQPFHFLQAFH